MSAGAISAVRLRIAYHSVYIKYDLMVPAYFKPTDGLKHHYPLANLTYPSNGSFTS